MLAPNITETTPARDLHDVDDYAASWAAAGLPVTVSGPLSAAAARYLDSQRRA